MDLPDLVREQLGSEQLLAGVALGDDNVICLTQTRVLTYTGEGLLSDESVEAYDLNVERLDIAEGRRKTKFVFEYVDGSSSLTVPNTRADSVLELVFQGVLRQAGVTDADESVAGVYRFSELTLVVTDRRLVKHVGTPVWDDDFEVYPFEAVTGLDFEEGSVATQIVLSVEGRPQRIKAPNDDAPMLRRTLEEVLFSFHDVDSLAQFNDVVAPEEEPPEPEQPDHLDLGSDIDPLVGGDPEPTESEPDPTPDEGARPERIRIDPRPGDESDTEAVVEDDAEPEPRSTARDEDRADELAALTEQIADLQASVEEQNELLRTHHEAIQQLVSELRQQR